MTPGTPPRSTLEVEFEFALDQVDFRGVMLRSPEGYRLELLHRAGNVAGPPGREPGRGGADPRLRPRRPRRARRRRGVRRPARRRRHRPDVAAPSPEPGVRMAYVADPEGNLIELLDRTAPSMTGRLDGKIALITGVGGGMGVAAARRFAAEGARVVGCDLDGDGAARTEALVRAEGGEITVHGRGRPRRRRRGPRLGRRRGRDVRRHRRPLQQRLHPALRRARRAEHRGLGLHDAQRARPRLLHGARRVAAPQGARRRLDHQRRLDRGDPRRGVHAAERALAPPRAA